MNKSKQTKILDHFKPMERRKRGRKGGKAQGGCLQTRLTDFYKPTKQKCAPVSNDPWNEHCDVCGWAPS